MRNPGIPFYALRALRSITDEVYASDVLSMDFIKECVALVAKDCPEIIEAYVIGDYANGKAVGASTIKMLIKTNNKINLHIVQNALAEVFDREVKIYDYDKYIARHKLKEVIEIYQKN